MAITQDRLKAVIDAGLTHQRASQQLRELVDRIYRQTSEQDEPDWTGAWRELMIMHGSPGLQEHAAEVLLAVENERWRLTHAENRVRKDWKERKRREMGVAQQSTAARAEGKGKEKLLPVGDFYISEEERKRIEELRGMTPTPTAPETGSSLSLGGEGDRFEIKKEDDPFG